MERDDHAVWPTLQASPPRRRRGWARSRMVSSIVEGTTLALMYDVGTKRAGPAWRLRWVFFLLICAGGGYHTHHTPPQEAAEADLARTRVVLGSQTAE